ncbi:MAG: HEPN domain-containing protein [Oligoflexia bacterium]|nr:HEPN domain-containing protein [Oligoflexia bacterium]
MKRPKYLSWLLQAENDLQSVSALIKSNHYAQACFNSQQAAEKALKSLAFFRGSDLVKSHSLITISKDLKINGELATFASKLDLYYLTARYPDALPENAVPSESITKSMAEEAILMAEAFLVKVKKEIQK